MKTICCSIQEGTITYLSWENKTLEMDFLLFVEEKLCLLLISTFSLCSILICYQANKSTFRTHFCCICSHVYTFHVAEFPFLGSQKFRVPKGDLVEGRKGSNAQTQYCCSALWAMRLSGGLCVILDGNISHQGMFQWHFISVTPPQLPLWTETIFHRSVHCIKRKTFICVNISSFSTV